MTGLGFNMVEVKLTTSGSDAPQAMPSKNTNLQAQLRRLIGNAQASGWALLTPALCFGSRDPNIGIPSFGLFLYFKTFSD